MPSFCVTVSERSIAKVSFLLPLGSDPNSFQSTRTLDPHCLNVGRVIPEAWNNPKNIFHGPNSNIWLNAAAKGFLISIKNGKVCTTVRAFFKIGYHKPNANDYIRFQEKVRELKREIK